MKPLSARLIIALLALLSLGVALRTQPPARAAGEVNTVYLPLVRRGAGAPANTYVYPTFDRTRVAHAEFGPEGGSLSASAADGTTFVLRIPPGALDFSETITMTPALSLMGLPLSGGLAGAVNLEPAGLSFYTPATLTITPSAAAPVDMRTVGFAFNAAGDGFHLRPLARSPAAAPQANAIAITSTLLWIRPEGVAWASRADLQAQLATLSPPLTAEQDLEVLISGLEALDLGVQVRDSLRQFYQDALAPHLTNAVSSPATLDQAIREYDAWMHFVTAEQLEGQLAGEIAAAKALLERAIATGATGASLRCYTQHRPEEGFAMLRWAHYARKYLPGAPIIAQIEAELAKCLQFKLTFHSTITAQAPNGGYVYELKAEVRLRGVAGSTRVTGSAPLRWLDYRWLGNAAPCVFQTSGTASTFNAASGALGLSIAPVSYTSPAVRLNLRYNPGKPLEHQTVVCPAGNTPLPTSSAWSTYFTKLHQYEFDSQGLNSTVAIRNVGTFTGWVYQNDLPISGGTVSEDTRIDLEHTPQQ